MKTSLAPFPRLYTPYEVARLLGWTPRQVADAARSGRLPVVKTVGGHRRYVADDVDRMAGRQRGAS